MNNFGHLGLGIRNQVVDAGQGSARPRLRSGFFSVGATALFTLAISGCGGSSNDSSAVAQAPGSILVNVTDHFGKPTDGAGVYWMGTSGSIYATSNAAGNATLNAVPSTQSGYVCAYHAVRGYSCGEEFTVTAGARSDLALQVVPYPSLPIAAVLGASVDPDGVGPDGRTLDITIRIAVTQAPATGSWFGDMPPLATDCVARQDQELIDLGPRCIHGPGGTDTSYAFGGLNGPSDPTTVVQPVGPATVGLLLDQSASIWTYENHAVEARLFAAKVFADSVLPDISLLLAGFAGDGQAADNLSPLAQKPVTFLPAGNPGLFVGKPETFDQLDGLLDLSGGVAPLYASILSAIDFVAANALPGNRRVLVVATNGRDDSCGTPAQCATARQEIAASSRNKNVEMVFLATDGISAYDFDGWAYPYSSRTEEAISTLAVDAPAPLIVGSYPTYLEAFALVKQLLGESVPVEDIHLRLTSDVPDAFQSGAIVKGELNGYTPANCPWDCYTYVLPFSLQLP